jgi:glycosyltransferase involved in cell wall biosynthesis
MLVRYYAPHKGGNERQCQLLSEHLAGNNAKVVVLTERYSGKLQKKEIINQVEIIRLSSLNTYFDISKVKSGNFFARLFRFGFYYVAEFSLMFNIFLFLRYQKVKNEVLHIHQNNWIAFWGILGINKRIPVIIKDATLNGFNELRLMPLNTYMKKRIIKDGRFVAISTDIRSNLLENGVKEENIYLIPNATIVPSKSNSYHNSQDIIFVGNFDQGKIKSLDILINAMIHVFKQNKETRLLIIGKGDPRSYLKLIDNYPLFKNRIQFLGQIDNISQYYLNSFIFVLPSRSEGMSNALLEAMSYGMPCISTKVSGSNDLIVNNQNGMLVDIGNDNQLAESILHLISHREFAYQLGKNARKTIFNNYQIDLIAREYMKLYNQTSVRNE